ncbi:MAG: malto-oligosyltrehalose trehalohydrolase [Gammaproteobacteria bacterium]|nr:malto-oligosyltrehalose trehalohydrolase [Gammaproteobacteria bacterium]
MPFGAEVGDGAVRFRLWAPAARSVELMLETERGSELIELSAAADGWFELVTDRASAGSLYRYRIDRQLEIPDPASRFNPRDVTGPSAVLEPRAFAWGDGEWRGRPWHEAIIYEVHTGSFTQQGGFRGIEQRLPYLADLGVTFIELMPIADFPGRFGWGYDGVLPFAPDSSYGHPEELKSLVCAAHRRGLAVLLDVVYNHFGPEGNYLPAYAPQFFNQDRQTPWGAAINFDGPDSATVRAFFLHNALFWLEEYRFDGLRFDAVHAIHDESRRHIIEEVAVAARAGPGRDRPIHLIVENAANEAHYLARPGTADKLDAQWNDDLHHSLHVILTGETDGYYSDFAAQPHAMLCRSLAQGFAFQGERSPFHGAQRGESSGHLPPTAFVNFLQNHDQVGNRALGERIGQLAPNADALRAALAVLLLAPSPPLIFMGEEWCAPQPFPYFCDFEPGLAEKVRAGRRQEFARFARFRDPAVWAQVPDPCIEATFASARLDWAALDQSLHARCLAYCRELLALRRAEIMPLVPQITAGRCRAPVSDAVVAVEWGVRAGALHLIANLSDRPARAPMRPAGRLIFSTESDAPAHQEGEVRPLAPWSVTWLLERDRR